MITAAMATYAYDQIDRARAELNAVSEKTRMRHPSATIGGQVRNRRPTAAPTAAVIAA